MTAPAKAPAVAQGASGPPEPPGAPPDLPDDVRRIVAKLDRAFRRLLPVLELAREPLKPDLWRIALED